MSKLPLIFNKPSQVPSVTFNGSTALTGGMTLSYARNYAIATAADGTIAAINTPVYADSQLFAGAPAPITLLTDGTATNIPASGLWTDGVTTCEVIFQEKSSPNPAYVNIYLGAARTAGVFDTPPSTRSLNIRCTATGNKTTALVDLTKTQGADTNPDESATRVRRPIGFTIVQGVILALCAHIDWNGSAWEYRGISALKWVEAESKFRVMFETRTVNAGQNRGREWLTNQYWILDGQNVQNSREVFVTWTDYQINAGGTGGQLLVIRLSRASTSDAWTIGEAVMPFEQSAISGRHFHGAFAERYGASGVVIGINVGDSAQSELMAIYRSDSSLYAEGWDSGTGAPTASNTDGATSNGWTTVREVAGAPTTEGNSPAYGWNQFMCAAALPTAHEYICSNDEGQQPVFKMIWPDFSAGETKARFETVNQPRVPDSIRRGVLNFFMGSNPSTRSHFASVAYRNSASQAATGAKNEKKRITFTEAGSPSGTFTLSIAFGGGTETTGAITYSSTPATMAANIDTALEALASMGAGTVTVAQFSGTSYDVTFTGTKASTAMPAMTINTGSLVNVTATTQRLLTGSGNTIAPSLTSSAGGYPQGFSASVAGETCKLMGSFNGTDWFIMGAPNSQVRPCVTPDGYVFCGGISSYGKIVAYQFPTVATARPLRVSPGTTNQLISTISTTSDVPTTNNSFTAINVGSQLGVAGGLITGRTIPKPPCNGAVYRATQNGASSAYFGAYTFTTGNPLVTPITGHRYIKKRLWIYQLPPSNPYGGDNVAPYNSPRSGIRVQIMRANTAAASFAAAGDIDSMDASGWVPVVIDTYTDEWGDYVSAAVNAAIKLVDNGSGASNRDLLIAFDLCQISATPDDLCVHPAPVAASASAMGHDTVTIDNVPIEFGDNWSALYLAKMPQGGWDQFMNVTHRPTNPRFFTLYQDVSGYIYCYADPVNRRLVIGDDFGSTSISPPSGEEFVFLPNSEIYVALSQSGTTLSYAVSIGGTQAKTGTFTLGAAIAPMQAIVADNATAPIAAHLLYKMQVLPRVTKTTTQLAAALNRLSL